MSLQKLTTTINTLESYIKNHEVYNKAVSKENVAWHIDHSLKVINNVCNALKTSDPSTYSNNFSVLGKVFFMLGFFPRGKAKAPKHVKPPEVILKEELIVQIKEAKSNISKIKDLDTNAYFKHPLFGHVNTKRVYRFLILHTTHHLKIIKDILK